MTQTEKDLLLKDLCGRLPYRVKVQIKNEIVVLDSICDDDGYHFNFIGEDREGVNIENIKPYLFPLSSMTEEQLYEVSQILGKDVAIFTDYLLTIDHRRRTFSYQELNALVNWFDKNHFDHRGLIPMGAAIDATGKNIY
jgi:hypothetical protein